jgi:hypothetical protein
MSDIIQPPSEQRKEPRKLRTIPQIIQYVLSIGISAKFDESLGGWFIPGFYKAKGIVIKFDDSKKPESGVASSILKKTIGQPILSFEDLIELNYAWWCISRKESVEYEMPDDYWKDEFHSLGMAERRMQFLPKAKTFNPLAGGA